MNKVMLHCSGDFHVWDYPAAKQATCRCGARPFEPFTERDVSLRDVMAKLEAIEQHLISLDRVLDIEETRG